MPQTPGIANQINEGPGAEPISPTTNNDDDDDGGDVAGTAVEASVSLGKTSRTCPVSSLLDRGRLQGYTVRRVHPGTLAAELDEPAFSEKLENFIKDQLELDTTSYPDVGLPRSSFDMPEKITVYPSAVATFHAPSDLCGTGGMRRERMRAVDSWRQGAGRYDCIFINTDAPVPGMRGMDVARAKLFFSFTVNRVKYPCALINWFSRVGDSVDENTGMWVVEPDYDEDGIPQSSIVHVDTIVRLAHLIPVFRNEVAPRNLDYTETLDTFSAFYVNRFADHHAFEITS